MDTQIMYKRTRRRNHRKRAERRTKFKEDKSNKRTTFYLLCDLIEKAVTTGKKISYSIIHTLWKTTFHEGKKLTTTIYNAIRWFNENRQIHYGVLAFYNKHGAIAFKAIH